MDDVAVISREVILSTTRHDDMMQLTLLIRRNDSIVIEISYCVMLDIKIYRVSRDDGERPRTGIRKRRAAANSDRVRR